MKTRLFLIPLLLFQISVASAQSIVLAAPPAIEQSGVLKTLLPAFRAKSGIDVRVIITRDSDVLELARRGDADLVVSHDCAGEDRLVREGFGLSRVAVMADSSAPHGAQQDASRRSRRQYCAIAVNPARYPHVRDDQAKRFIDWLTSAEGQALIAAHRPSGQQIFQPAAVKNRSGQRAAAHSG